MAVWRRHVMIVGGRGDDGCTAADRLQADGCGLDHGGETPA